MLTIPETKLALPIGTRVRIASGGPEMLIVDYDFSQNEFICAWKGSDGGSFEGSFPPITLDIVRSRVRLDHPR